MILDELSRVNGILSDFLSLARNKQVDKVPTELGGLVEELEPFIMAECNKRGIQYRAYLTGGLPKIVADRKEIKQLILNLVCNAVEAMGQHGELAIFTTVAEQGVRLIVADTGYGISSEQVEKIFDPFFTTKADGTGLGLAVCKSIVDRHNGSIAVMSEPGRGTRFITTFPAWKDQELVGDLQQDLN
jgi:two-component system, sporulation sensor kinase E